MVIALVVLVVLVTKGSGTTMLEVPNFVGEVFKEIDPEKYPNLRLVDSDYTYSNEYEAGKVISQDPVARTQVAEGSTVKLVISNGPQTGQMGDLVNRTEEKAREYLDGLKDLHLSVTLEEEFSSDIAAGRVTRTDPEADEILTVGQTVTLWISKGPQTADFGRPCRPAPDQCRGLSPEFTRYESGNSGGEGSQRGCGRGENHPHRAWKGRYPDGRSDGDPLCEHRQRCGDDDGSRGPGYGHQNGGVHADRERI